MRYRFSYVLILSFFLLSVVDGFPQGGRLTYLDSVRHRLDTAHVTAEKVEQLMVLAALTLEQQKAEGYASEAIELAQLNRDPRLIAKTYLRNASRLMNNLSVEKAARVLKNLQRGEQVAKENGLEDVLVQAYYEYAELWVGQGNNTKALTYSTEALAVAADVDNDSAKAEAYNAAGEVYMSMNQMLLALRNFLNALDVAEKSGDRQLLRKSYSELRRFYAGIGETDKALDYAVKQYDVDHALWSDDLPQDLINTGDLYVDNQPDLALKMYDESIHMADTFRFDLLKANAYHRTFLLYLKTQQYEKGMQFLYAHPDLLDIMQKIGVNYYLHELLAVNYTKQGRYDSAMYYFRRSEPEALANAEPDFLFDFDMNFGEYYRKTNNLPQAILYCNKAYALAASTNALDQEAESTDSLEKLYVTAGNYPAALVCEQRGADERDSIRTQTQATDLMKLEVENDGRRRERLAREEQERTEHRHNIQYMGFTIGLVVLFVALVMLARLSVPVWLIRAFVFVVFIFLFEFIIMLADKQIQGWTAEEPWKVLLLKIILAAGMVPLHHWLEHKVVHYLSRHKHDGSAKTDVSLSR
jgi:tetratricopeptide (TPR) repeat protein